MTIDQPLTVNHFVPLIHVLTQLVTCVLSLSDLHIKKRNYIFGSEFETVLLLFSFRHNLTTELVKYHRHLSVVDHKM